MKTIMLLCTTIMCFTASIAYSQDHPSLTLNEKQLYKLIDAVIDNNPTSLGHKKVEKYNEQLFYKYKVKEQVFNLLNNTYVHKNSNGKIMVNTYIVFEAPNPEPTGEEIDNLKSKIITSIKKRYKDIKRIDSTEDELLIELSKAVIFFESVPRGIDGLIVPVEAYDKSYALPQVNIDTLVAIIAEMKEYKVQHSEEEVSYFTGVYNSNFNDKNYKVYDAKSILFPLRNKYGIHKENPKMTTFHTIQTSIPYHPDNNNKELVNYAEKIKSQLIARGHSYIDMRPSDRKVSLYMKDVVIDFIYKYNTLYEIGEYEDEFDAYLHSNLVIEVHSNP